MERIDLFFSVIHDRKTIFGLDSNHSSAFRPSFVVLNTLIDMESVDPRKLEELLLKTKPSYSNFPVANEIPNREPLVWMLDTPLKYFLCVFASIIETGH